MACFVDINVSQGSVATYVRCGGTHLTANLPRNLPVNFFLNRFILRRNCGRESGWPLFGAPCTYTG